MLHIVNHTGAADDDLEPMDFHVGQRVKHPTFGVGEIVDLSKSGTGRKAIVDFRISGRKTLLLEFARLEPASS